MDTDQENKLISNQLDALTIEPRPGPESNPAPESSSVSASALQKIARSDMKTLYSSLGSGIFSDVYVAKYKDQKIALKKYKTSKTDPVQEACVHANLDHMNIVKLIGYIQEDSMSALLLEYCNENDLDVYLEYGEVSDSEREREKIALDIAKGLVYLHEVHRIIHREIKPGNILLHKKNKDITAKITDFGFAKKLKDNETGYTGTASGTPAYACPEILASSHNGLHTSSFPGDIFAFGHIIHLLTQSGNTNPLQGFETLQQAFTFIKEGCVSRMPLFEAYSTATTRTLIRCCHMTDPKTRITANEIVKQFESGHTLFQSLKMK